MDVIDPPDALLPAALLAEVEAMAAIEGRPVKEMLREAVEQYVLVRRPRAEAKADPTPSAKRTPREAAARMLARRSFHPLPEGMSIRDLITHGRA